MTTSPSDDFVNGQGAGWRAGYLAGVMAERHRGGGSNPGSPLLGSLMENWSSLFEPGVDAPLYMAAQKGHTEVVERLLAAPGVDVNLTYNLGTTPLYEAAQRGHTEVVDVNRARSNGATPLFAALARGNADVAQKLQAAGATATYPSPT